MLIGAYMDIDRCLKVLKVPTGAYRCLQVGTGGHRWQVLGDLQICPIFFNKNELIRLVLSIYIVFACFSSIYLLMWSLWQKNPKSVQNRPYLSLQLLHNCSHQKSFTAYIFQIFA